MKPREERITVVIPSRMRIGNAWSDVCIRNISSRGLLVAAQRPPHLGDYVEIRRGTQIIIARAVWTNGQFCGLRSQEKLPIQRIISEPRLTSKPEVAIAEGQDRRRERRDTGPSIAEREQRSRRIAAAFQYVLFAAIFVGAAGWAATSVFDLLGDPLHQVSQALGG